MYDSDDDYFSGDLVLDDKTVAFLDEQESKFRRISSTQPQQSTVGPPPKRQKTTESWKPQSVSNRALRRVDTLEEEDLPDVSIQQDGTYGLQQRRSSRPPSRPEIATISSGIVVQAIRGTSVIAPVRAAQIPSRSSSSPHGTRFVQSPVSSQEAARTQYKPPQRVDRVSSTPASSGYVEQLLQQIEELRKKNETIQTSIESALEAKFAKEGEVAILRKRMEKTAQEHLAQLAKLKAAKDEADANHVLLQKQYDVDKERLKTELTFRHHEIETSSRKNAVPVLLKNDMSQVTGPLPTQRQRSGQWGLAGPSRPPPEAPRRPRFGVISEFEKPKKSILVEARDLPSGFQTGLPRSQVTQGREGRETASFTSVGSVQQVDLTMSAAQSTSLVIPSASSPSQESTNRFRQSEEAFATQMDDGGPMEDFVPQVDPGADDVRMVEGTPVLTLSSQENTTVLGLPNWNRMLHDIVTAHTLQVPKRPTLQLLVCTFPTDIDQVQSHGAALMRIFDTLGNIPAHLDGDFDRAARTVCCALCELAESLAKNNLIFPLTAVLNLLTTLAYMLPPIHILLLSQRVSENDGTPQVLGVLHNIIQNQLRKLDAAAGTEHPELCSLGKEALSLYEALVWGLPDDLEDMCLSRYIILAHDITPTAPSPVVSDQEHACTFMVVDKYDSCNTSSLPVNLLSGRDLFRSLTCPTREQAGNSPEPIILTCSLLTDTDRQGPEADELKSLIIMFFGMVSTAHSDAHALLVESQELIPSIALYLHHLVAPIWDENWEVFNDPQALTRKIHIINHTALLLHHLVFGGDATLDLRERLLRPPARTYQGLIHFFILTLGRLSYATPPYWLEAKDRQRLVGLADLARALLERVIQGPELDLIWETYHDEGDDLNEAAMDVDDEEAEAQRIADA